MKRISLLIVLVIFSGCSALWGPNLGRQYSVDIDAISAQGVSLTNKTYFLMPLQQNTDQLQNQEFSTYIHRALESKGMKPVKSPIEADQVIVFGYAFNKEIKEKHSVMPIWGQTGVASSNTTGSTNSLGGGVYSFNSQTNYTPQYGVVGGVPVTKTIESYTKVFALFAMKGGVIPQGMQPESLWRGMASTNDYDDDFRGYFPGMVAAAMPFFATNPGQKTVSYIREKSPEMLTVKGLPLASTDGLKQ